MKRSIRYHCLALGALLTCLLLGCSSSERLETRYGRSRGSAGESSVNGLSIFAGMFQQQGWEVIRGRTTQGAFDQATTLVWAPDDFQPPSDVERATIEDWLEASPGRTAIYIGRDYDAAAPYWTAVVDSASDSQAEEITRRRAEAKAYHDAERGQMPQEEYAGWFTLKRDGPPQRVQEFGGPWADGLDAQAANVWIEAELLPPTQTEIDDFVASYEENSEFVDAVDVADIVSESEWEDWDRIVKRQSEFEFYVFLSAGEQDLFEEEEFVGTPLIMSVEHSDWDASDVLVVNNGSFLFNLPLVNHEHRKIAGDLIDYCGEPGTVIFWEGSMLTSSSSEVPPSEQSLFTTWPVNFVLFHLALLGFLYCLWKFPIFGRPRRLPQESTSEFGTHIEALGELMATTQQSDYARQRLAAYREAVKQD